MTVTNTAARNRKVSVLAALGTMLALLSSPPVHAEFDSFRPFLPLQVSTAPANGDLNPYGLVFVPAVFPSGGVLKPGQMLVSNFNDTSLQGRGSTIITIDPNNGQTGLFFQGTPPIGFTNTLGVVHAGLVFAGSVFTQDGTSSTAASGGLYVLDASGHVVTTFGASKLINGPWGLAINDQGLGAQLFVSNVFDGTVTRLDVTFGNGSPTVRNFLKIGSGYGFGPDTAAVVVGPAGLAYDALQDILFVASEKDDTIFALRGAGRTHTDLGTGTVVYQDAAHLHGPLGLIFAPNGDLLVANADPNVSQDPTEPSEIVEFTRSGSFVRQYSVDPNLGSAFALGVSRRDGGRLRGTVREDVTSSQPASNARWCSARIPRAVSATMRSSLPPGRVGRLVTRCLRIIVRPGRGVILPSFAMVLGRLGSLETEDTRQHGTPRSSIPVAMRGSVLTPARTVAQKRRGPPWWPP